MRIETRPLAAADIDRAAEVLGLAFADYPWTRWVVEGGDHVGRITELQRLILQHVALPYGRASVTTVDDIVQSVASWFDTAQTMPSDIGEIWGPPIAELEGDRHDASAAADGEVHGWRPINRHLYLATMGTNPSHQGSGLGTRTLQPGIESADREQLLACLETSSSSNVKFYSRLGFETVRNWRIADGAGPEVWTMQRLPASADQRFDGGHVIGG